MSDTRSLAHRFLSALAARAAGARAVRRTLGTLRFGLDLKLLLIVISVSLAGALVASVLILSLQRQQLIESTEKSVTHVSVAVAASLHHAMLTNDRTMAGQIIQTMVTGGGADRIRILDPQGVVRVSSDESAVGKRFDRAGPACSFCHASGAAASSRTTILELESGRSSLFNVTVIRNEAQCEDCHVREAGVLGLLMIEAPLTDLDSQLAAGFWRMVASALITLVVLTSLMVAANRRLILRPVSALVSSVARISAGDLDSRVQAASRDELGDLAESFDGMRQKLQAARADMERRNHELSVLNEIALRAGQLLDLQQILDLALEMAVGRLGMQAGAIYMLEEGSERFTLRGCLGLSDEQCREVERIRLEPGGDVSQRVAQTGEPIFVGDMSAEPRFQTMWPDLAGRSYLNVPLRSRGRVVGTMGLVTYAGQPLTEQGIGVLRMLGHEIGIAIDNALLVAQTRADERIATSLYELGTQVSGSLKVDEVLESVAEGARQVLAADIGVVGLLDEEQQTVSVRAAAGARTEALRGLTVSLRDDSLGSALRSGRPIMIEEQWSSMPLPHDKDPLVAEGAVSFLAVPLTRGERMAGLVGVMSRRQRRFSETDIRLLLSLANHVAVAIENAQLYERVRRLVALEERERLARELHDQLAQGLAILNVQASLISELLSSGKVAPAQATLPEFKRVAQETYTDVREAIFGLHTAAPSGAGLLPMLRDYLEEYHAHYGLDARLEVECADLAPFSPDVDVQVLRIIQEALSNVRKHAQAGSARVRFQMDGDCVRISVEDAGRGFDPEGLIGEGSRYFGLNIMRERAESVGASLVLDSRPGQGTRVVIRVPRALGR